jgi:hypothetical protein
VAHVVDEHVDTAVLRERRVSQRPDLLGWRTSTGCARVSPPPARIAATVSVAFGVDLGDDDCAPCANVSEIARPIPPPPR